MAKIIYSPSARVNLSGNSSWFDVLPSLVFPSTNPLPGLYITITASQFHRVIDIVYYIHHQHYEKHLLHRAPEI